MMPLFDHYPLLREKLPYISLGDFPTPIEKLDRLSKEIGVNHLYIKRDDLSGSIYGGNKVRKLEFILAQAQRLKTKGILTFGGAGSNHALACAIYAQQVGLKSISMLLPQPNAHYVRRNLLASHYYGAELHQYRNILLLALGTIYQRLRHKLKYGYVPQVVPFGGSSPLGVIGFVNAAFELKNQVWEGKIPEPDRIYVALGSNGTAVGLMLGLKAAGLKSKVISVRVTDEKFANPTKITKLFYRTNSLLHRQDPSFPEFKISRKELNIRHEFFGQRYALFTKEGIEAIIHLEKTEGIKLEGTYTGKTFAALIHDAAKQDLKDEVIVFWNTHNSRSFSEVATAIDYHKLPRCFHGYFEEEVQPLDQGW